MNPDATDRRTTYATLTLLTTEQGGRESSTADEELYVLIKVADFLMDGRLYNKTGQPMRPGGTYEVVVMLLWGENFALLLPGQTYEVRYPKAIGHLRIVDTAAD